ncbi:MAG: DUF2190 family protein [Verrucomicrobia bacterium]|nr:DUF2190 family protein [Verrucomicrobiota bacterium]
MKNKIKSIHGACLRAIAGLAANLALFVAGLRNQCLCANIAEGVHGSGQITKKADGALTTRYLLAKIGSDADHVDAAGVADIPLGIITDEAAAAEDLVNVALLGAIKGTQRMIASAAITAGDLLVSAASGKVRTLPAAAATYYIIGRALIAASADGDTVEVAPSFPVQRVVV